MSTFRLSRHIKKGMKIIPQNINIHNNLYYKVIDVNSTSEWISFRLEAAWYASSGLSISIKFLPTDFVEVVPDMIDENGEPLLT